MLNIGEFARLGQVSPRMLRHYDETGLLVPFHVEHKTGYRIYEIAQLPRLHRLVALRDLGFTLEQTRQLLDDDVTVEQLRGMLLLRRAQIEETVAEEQARIHRVEAHLRAIERNITMPSPIDVVIKTTDPVRIAEISTEAPGFGNENLGPVFERVVPQVLDYLNRAGVRPGILIAWYEWPTEDGAVVLHAGFEIGDQQLNSGESISVVVLPSLKVASVLHRGPMDTITTTYEALVRWIEDSGQQIGGYSRELYLEWDGEHPERNVTDLQMPLAG